MLVQGGHLLGGSCLHLSQDALRFLLLQDQLPLARLQLLCERINAIAVHAQDVTILYRTTAAAARTVQCTAP